MPNQPTEAGQAEVLALLNDRVTFGGQSVQTVETHAARIFLVGRDAYKLKRAVRYPFLDFTSLSERERVCRREVELNQRTAPELYLDCLPVTREATGKLTIDGEGAPVEWLVHMRRFDAQSTLDHAMGKGFPDSLFDDLADEVAALHELAEPSAGTDPVDRVRRVLEGNLVSLADEPSLFDPALVRQLDERTRRAIDGNSELLVRRAEGGHVRRCHGDLHLGNVALIDERPVIFDALEFDEELATTDILYDLAFLLMDCWVRGAKAQANRMLNRWIGRRRRIEDLNGLSLLPLFLSMRAAVRAKVAAARAAGHSGGTADEAAREAREYLATALEMLDTPRPRLVAIGGFSGSGKSAVARGLACRILPAPGAVIIRSDQVRKELAGVGELERLPPSSYTSESADQVYAEMRDRAARVVRSGHSAIADAVHGTAEERDAIAVTASQTGAIFSGIWLEADPATLAARVTARRSDASDATAAVVTGQLDKLRPPQDWPHVPNSGSLEEAVRRAEEQIE